MRREETEKKRERSLVNVPVRDLRITTSEKTGIIEIVIGLGIEIEIGIGIGEVKEREIVAMTAIEHVIEEGIEVVTRIGIVIGTEIGTGIGITKGDILTLIVVAPMIRNQIMIELIQNMKRIDMVIKTETLIVLKMRMVVGGMISLSMGTDTKILIMIPNTMITLNIPEVGSNMITQKAIVTQIVTISMIKRRMITIMSVGHLNHMIERGLVV